MLVLLQGSHENVSAFTSISAVSFTVCVLLHLIPASHMPHWDCVWGECYLTTATEACAKAFRKG